MIKNILLSGGWGYGNLGDDALLEASIKILKKMYPVAKITVMSYDISTSCVMECNVVSSLHRAIYDNRAYNFLRVYGRYWNYDKYPFYVARIINKIDRIMELYRPKSVSLLESFQRNIHTMQYFDNLFQQTDMFVMSGGGYFNGWEDSFYSRYMELQFAKQARTSTYIIGQTIGPFTTEQTQLIKPLMRQVKGIYVRDVESEKDLRAMECIPIVAPDLALSYVGRGVLNDSICIIPAEYPSVVRGELIKALELIAKRTSMPIILTATRLYNRDINCLKHVYIQLKSKGIKVRVVIPRDYNEMKETIKGNKYVISRNLHGLILGWREGSKCLCLCNERKFISFMNQIGCEDFIVDIYKNKAEDIYLMFENLMNMHEDHLAKQQEIANDVVQACRATFNS